MKSYEFVQQLLKNYALSDKQFYATKLYNEIKNDNGYLYNENFFKVNIQSMCMEKDPQKCRIRSDKFLKLAIDNKSALIVAPYSLDAKNIYHIILTNEWFFNYDHSISSSNSFMNFDFYDLSWFVDYPGYQYKKIGIKKVLTKYVFLVVKDSEFDIQKIYEYIEFSKSFNKYGSAEILLNSTNKNDPKIPNYIKERLYKEFDYSCAIHSLNPNYCRTKMDWKRTKEALTGTNLNVPIDFHHFIPRSLFKSEWYDKKIEDLNWQTIHSEINIVPLCQICHQSIHNKDKALAKETFFNIINVLKRENKLDIFNKYITDSKVVNNLDDLLNFYLK